MVAESIVSRKVYATPRYTKACRVSVRRISGSDKDVHYRYTAKVCNDICAACNRLQTFHSK